MNNKYILGIDTSNYKTSIAVTDLDQSIICDLRKFLKVKHGEKGLRQSEAHYQHVNNIPDLMNELRSVFSGRFAAVAYASKPRPVENSFMPVFLAGQSFAKTIAAAMNIPAWEFSHQEGHIEAVKAYSTFKDEQRILACHFSGGTSELLEVSSHKEGYNIDIIGGTKDISFGQVIDRAGTLLGVDFPCGEELDKTAMSTEVASDLLTPIKVQDAWLNLSGIDTQIKRLLSDKRNSCNQNELIKELFEKFARAMAKMIIQGAEKKCIDKVLMAGGVSSSKVLKIMITEILERSGITPAFDDTDLAQDNAVGISLLGGKLYGTETR